MRKHFLIGLRNLLRNPRRTTITLLAIIFGIIGILSFAGYVDYSMLGLREIQIRGGIGHYQIYQKGYTTRKGESALNYLIENTDKTYKYLMALPYIVEAIPSLTGEALISTGDKTKFALIQGIDAEKEKAFGDFKAKVVTGSEISKSDNYKIIIGKILAENLGVKVGDMLTIMATTKYGAINAVDVEVKGIVNTGIKEYDKVLVKMPLKTLQELLDVQGIEKYIIILEDTEYTKKFGTYLDKLIKRKALSLEYKNWQNLATFYFKVKGMYEAMLSIIEIIIIVIVVFSIINIMSTIIFERMREIGTIRAIGLKKSGVMFMFLSEAFWLAIVGSILGILIYQLVSFLINNSGGIYIPPPPTMTQGYYAMFMPTVSRYFEAIGIAVLSVFLGSILPALKAARIKIVDAIRYV